jgi:KaiC/GvpD/RAD55 family RecA-like ATPase
MSATRKSPDAAQSADREAKPGPIIYRKMSEIEAKPIRWLWPGRIARGKVSMIAGHPGLGKSQITASIAATVTKGGRWPVDMASCECGNALFLSAEDDPADTIRPRLEAAGADLERISVLQAVRDGFNAEGNELQRAFNLNEDIRKLEELLKKIGNVALVIIDPVSAYLGGADSHKMAEVRALLAPLSDMAARTGAAVVAVSHLNKGGGSGAGDALLRITGSLGFVAAARAAYIVAKDPESDARRMFLPGKNNIGPDIGGLAFRIESCTIGTGIETSRIAWEPEAITGISADELLRAPADPEERSALDDAKVWLRSVLADGPLPANQIFGEASEAGHAEKTVRRAQRAIGIDPKKDGNTGPWLWALPVEDGQKAEDGQR